MRDWRILARVVAGLVLLHARSGWAQETVPDDEMPCCSCPKSKEGYPPKRKVPDYDGKGPEPTTPGDVLIWIPRAIFFPPYLVSEYLIREPLGAGITYAEEHHWPSSVFNFFAFGPEHQSGIFPTFFIDFNMRPSFGLHFFWSDALARGNRMSADIAYGGHDWVSIGVGDSYSFSKTESLSLQAKWNRRPDGLYYGIGSSVTDQFISRVATDVVLVSLTYKTLVGKMVALETAAAWERTVFRDYTCCNNPTLQQRVEAGQLPPPPGYQVNTTSLALGVKAVVDTRLSQPGKHSGLRAAVGLGLAGDVVPSFDTSWARYGAAVEGFFDVTGAARVLSIGITAQFVDPLGSQPVAFTNLVGLGGVEPFVGFNPGWLRDRSALAVEVGWHWPVFAFVDGVAAVSMGNVFDAHLDNFRFDLLRLSAELGIRTSIPGPSSFQFVIGLGTNTIAQGFTVASFRLAFGVVYGL